MHGSLNAKKKKTDSSNAIGRHEDIMAAVERTSVAGAVKMQEFMDLTKEEAAKDREVAAREASFMRNFQAEQGDKLQATLTTMASTITQSVMAGVGQVLQQIVPLLVQQPAQQAPPLPPQTSAPPPTLPTPTATLASAGNEAVAATTEEEIRGNEQETNIDLTNS